MSEERLVEEAGATREILVLTADAERAGALIQSLGALGIAALWRQSLDEGVRALAEMSSAIVLLDTGLVSSPDEIGLAARVLIPRPDVSGVCLMILARKKDIRYRLAAMRAGADCVFLLEDSASLIAARLAVLLDLEPNGPPRVLVVDDQPVAALFASRVLQGAGIITERVTDPLECLTALERFEPDLVLMDLHMPGASGIELTALIRAQERFVDLPIVFLSGELDPKLQIAALRIGGDDFLSKPVTPDRLLETVSGRLERARQRRRSQGLEEIDPLTRLATREPLLKRLDWLLGQAYSVTTDTVGDRMDRGPVARRAILYLDLADADGALELAAAEMAARIHSGEMAARVGDCAIAALVSRQSHDEIAELAQGLLFDVGQAIDESALGGKVGGGWYPLTGGCRDAVTLLSRAAKAAHWSRRNNDTEAGRYDDVRSSVEPNDHRREILEAVRIGRMELLYEPMVALRGAVGERYEVTPRLCVGDGELLPPADFMSIVAGAGLAPTFDRWLLNAGLDALQRKLEANQSALLLIHQSIHSVVEDEWIHWVRDQINARDLIRLRPVIQLETAEVDPELELAVERARQLGRLGIRVCLNGLDCSEDSLRILNAVTFAYARISQDVVHGSDDEAAADLIDAIKGQGAKVIAGGVDGPETVARLCGVGVDLIQGPYIQPPSIAMDFEIAVAEGSSL